MFGISDVFAIIASRPNVIYEKPTFVIYEKPTFVIYEKPTFVTMPVLSRKAMSHIKK
jgi:hypothetical protein